MGMTEDDQKFWDMIHNTDTSTLVLVGIVEQITLIMRDRRFDFLDWIYETAEIEKMNITTMLTLVRVVYMGREMLPNWQMFVGKLKQEAERRGQSSSILLQGWI